MLDHVVRIDDERRAKRHAFAGVTHAELVDERARGVGELPVVQALEIAVVAPPAELREFIVGRTAEHDGVAIFEILRELREADDFGRTDKREILRVEIDDLPLPRERLLIDRLECGDPVFLVLIEPGLHADDVERSEFLAYGFHAVTLSRNVCQRFDGRGGRFITQVYCLYRTISLKLSIDGSPPLSDAAVQVAGHEGGRLK